MHKVDDGIILYFHAFVHEIILKILFSSFMG